MHRMTIPEAADALGLTRDAIRKRVKRGSIEWEVEHNGETYVYVDASGHNGDASGHNGDTSETVDDTSGLDGDMSEDASGQALVKSLQEQIEYLRGEVGVWQEEARRKDHLLAAALERIPAIEAPETPGSPESADEPASDNHTPAPENEPRRPWYVRWFS